MITVKEKIKNSFKELKETLGLVNSMQAPVLEKIVINIGTGSLRDKNKTEIIEDRLAKITGQKPSARAARMSIATFKLREGEVVGYTVTLRGKRMYDFLERLLNIALPRTKDFRGIPDSGIDEMGNMTLGIKDHTIFPETADEDVRDIFGFAMTFVTNLHDKQSARKFFEYLGFPFKKVENQ